MATAGQEPTTVRDERVICERHDTHLTAGLLAAGNGFASFGRVVAAENRDSVAVFDLLAYAYQYLDTGQLGEVLFVEVVVRVLQDKNFAAALTDDVDGLGPAKLVHVRSRCVDCDFSAERLSSWSLTVELANKTLASDRSSHQ